MTESHEPRGTGGELPWAFVLDPSANARALGDVQRRGLHAAQELVERLVSSVDRFGEAPAATASDAGSSDSKANPLLMGLVQAWWELASQAMAAFGELSIPHPEGTEAPVTRKRTDQPVVVDLTGELGRPALRLLAGPNGQIDDHPVLWFHNPSSDPVGPFGLVCEGLRSSQGGRIQGRSIRFDPKELDSVPARSAREVSLSICGERGLEPGTYLGVVDVEGAPKVSVDLEIMVADRSS